MVAFYPIVIGAALVGFIGPWVALVLLGIPRLVEVLRVFSKPRPEMPPHSYVGWPLWFVGAAFVHTRRAGGAADPGPAAERDPADPAALGLSGGLEERGQVAG